MRRAAAWLAHAAALALAGSAGAADAPAAAPATVPEVVAAGRAAFQRVCAPCHARGPGLDGSPMLPGAAALAARHKGAVSPFLEERSDLGAEAIRVLVRQGSGAMPMFRKTEISDVEIAAIAAYLAASAASQSRR